MKKITALSVLFVFGTAAYFSDLFMISRAETAVYGLPAASDMLDVSKHYSGPVLRGFCLDPENPLNISFIVDAEDEDKISQSSVQPLIDYFLAGLTVPLEDLWVNLSPYEHDRILPEALSETEMGKQLLGQDYILKQLSSSLTNPDTELGRKYWSSLKADSLQLKAVQSETLNKIWITPETAGIYDSKYFTYITESSLKVESENVSESVLLPVLKDDVNNGRNFDKLRQIYHSTILALVFKQKVQDSFYRHYINKNKTSGINIADKDAQEKIWKLYCESFQRGVYDVNRKISAHESLTYKKSVKRFFSGGYSAASALDVIKKTEVSSSDLSAFAHGPLYMMTGSAAASLSSSRPVSAVKKYRYIQRPVDRIDKDDIDANIPDPVSHAFAMDMMRQGIAISDKENSMDYDRDDLAYNYFYFTRESQDGEHSFFAEIEGGGTGNIKYKALHIFYTSPDAGHERCSARYNYNSKKDVFSLNLSAPWWANEAILFDGNAWTGFYHDPDEPGHVYTILTRQAYDSFVAQLPGIGFTEEQLRQVMLPEDEALVNGMCSVKTDARRNKYIRAAWPIGSAERNAVLMIRNPALRSLAEKIASQNMFVLEDITQKKILMIPADGSMRVKWLISFNIDPYSNNILSVSMDIPDKNVKVVLKYFDDRKTVCNFVFPGMDLGISLPFTDPLSLLNMYTDPEDTSNVRAVIEDSAFVRLHSEFKRKSMPADILDDLFVSQSEALTKGMLSDPVDPILVYTPGQILSALFMYDYPEMLGRLDGRFGDLRAHWGEEKFNKFLKEMLDLYENQSSHAEIFFPFFAANLDYFLPVKAELAAILLKAAAEDRKYLDIFTGSLALIEWAKLDINGVPESAMIESRFQAVYSHDEIVNNLTDYGNWLAAKRGVYQLRYRENVFYAQEKSNLWFLSKGFGADNHRAFNSCAYALVTRAYRQSMAENNQVIHADKGDVLSVTAQINKSFKTFDLRIDAELSRNNVYNNSLYLVEISDRKGAFVIDNKGRFNFNGQNGRIPYHMMPDLAAADDYTADAGVDFFNGLNCQRVILPDTIYWYIRSVIGPDWLQGKVLPMSIARLAGMAPAKASSSSVVADEGRRDKKELSQNIDYTALSELFLTYNTAERKGMKLPAQSPVSSSAVNKSETDAAPSYSRLFEAENGYYYSELSGDIEKGSITLSDRADRRQRCFTVVFQWDSTVPVLRSEPVFSYDTQQQSFVFKHNTPGDMFNVYQDPEKGTTVFRLNNKVYRTLFTSSKLSFKNINKMRGLFKNAAGYAPARSEEIITSANVTFLSGPAGNKLDKRTAIVPSPDNDRRTVEIDRHLAQTVEVPYRVGRSSSSSAAEAGDRDIGGIALDGVNLDVVSSALPGQIENVDFEIADGAVIIISSLRKLSAEELSVLAG